MSRELDWTTHTLTQIIATATWLEAHSPDLYELAYGPSSSSDGDRVQSSGHTDVGNRLGITQPADDEEERKRTDRIGTSPQHAWHNVSKILKSVLVDLERAEYATNEQFTAGQSPEPDRPGRDTRMPRHIARQVHQAAARRRARGEWTPAELKEAPRP